MAELLQKFGISNSMLHIVAFPSWYTWIKSSFRSEAEQIFISYGFDLISI